MTSLDLSFPCPAENLALDEALLDAAEAGALGESLRFWESPVHFVVVGYANKMSTEVNASACERLGIPIHRRCSGGGTVLQGPGVLNYSLLLRITEGTPLAGITSANQFIMQRSAEAMTSLLIRSSGRESAPSDPPESWSGLKPAATIQVQGHTDLAIGGLKFSGNAQRRKRNHLIFHGAILLNLDLDLLEEVLPMPTLQPGYRAHRSHRDFLTQLSIPADAVKQALRAAWCADERLDLDSSWPGWRKSVESLVAEKYSKASWNLRTATDLQLT